MCRRTSRNCSMVNTAATRTLRRIFHPHEAHGIGLIWKQFPSHSAVEKNPHLVFQVALALWREVKSLQPLFDSKWFDLIDRVLAPLCPDVVLQPALIASRSRVPVKELFHESAPRFRFEVFHSSAV